MPTARSELHAGEAGPAGPGTFFSRAPFRGAMSPRPALAVLALLAPALAGAAPAAGQPEAGDARAPGVVRWETLDLTHERHLLRAVVDEHALGRLVHWRQGAPESATASQTFQPALQLDFDLLALRPATTYEYQLTVRDEAGNNATTDVRTFTTLPRPDAPAPRILAVEPPADAALAAPVARVEVRFDPQGEVRPREHVRLIVDKRDVPGGFEVADGTLAYAPQPPLGPGRHTVAVVLQNAAGGRTEHEWSFEVRTAAAPAPAVLALAALALAARRAAGRDPRGPRGCGERP